MTTPDDYEPASDADVAEIRAQVRCQWSPIIGPLLARLDAAEAARPTAPTPPGEGNIGSLRQDDSAHWYFIPLGMDGHFDDWVAYTSGDDNGYEGPDYEEFRLEMHPGQYVFEMKGEKP